LYIIIFITGFLDFVHRPEFYKQENTTFRKLDLFPSSGEGGGIYSIIIYSIILLAVRLREHKHNFKEGLIEKSKLAQHAYEEDHEVMWDEARVLEVESKSRYRKYKESAHMACSRNPISQPSLDTSPIWIFLPFGSPLSVMR
jgi:hypothetical protein